MPYDLSRITFVHQYSFASFKKLCALAFPLIFALASTSILGFCERLFLVRHSLESLEAYVVAFFLCQLFQLCLIYLTSTTQVFVAQNIGKSEKKEAGVYTWQMIWLSLSTLLVTLPLGFLAEKLFFHGILEKDSSISYFRFMMVFNFLFPLNATLISFFLGLGKSTLVFVITLLTNGMNIVLSALFIFGFTPMIPSMGIRGAAIAIGISQLLNCSILLTLFLRKNERKNYGTNRYQIQWKAMTEGIKVGWPRALTKGILLIAWLMNIHLMNVKGGDFLLTLSIGSSLWICIFFINEGIGQAILTMASYLVGKKDMQHMNDLLISSLFLHFLISAILFFPFFLFPKKIIGFFLKYPLQPEQLHLLIKTCMWLWVWFVCNGINQIAFSLITAFKDTLFTLVYNGLSAWLISYLPISIFIGKLNYSPETFYAISAFSGLFSALVYFLRFAQLRTSHFGYKKLL